MPARKRNFWQRGAIDPLTAIGLAILLIALPAAVRLVQERQQIEKEARIDRPCKVCDSERCVTVASPPICNPSLNECSLDSNCSQPTPTLRPHSPTPSPRPTPSSKRYRCSMSGICFESRYGNYTSLSACRAACQAPTPTPSCKQKHQSCSGSGQGNCCSGLKCAPLPGGKFCITPGCQEGKRKCSEIGGNYVQECQNGQWINIRRCDAGCSNSACKQVCTPGTTRCFDSKTQETCSSDGGAWGKKSCPYGCSKRECQAAPTPTPRPTATPTPIARATPTPTPRPTPTLIAKASPTPTPTPVAAVPPGICRGLYEKCDLVPCCSGLVCSGENVTCVKPIGLTCSSDEECGTCIGTSAQKCINNQCTLVPNDRECVVAQRRMEIAGAGLIAVDIVGVGVVAVATAPTWLPAAAPALKTVGLAVTKVGTAGLAGATGTYVGADIYQRAIHEPWAEYRGYTAEESVAALDRVETIKSTAIDVGNISALVGTSGIVMYYGGAVAQEYTAYQQAAVVEAEFRKRLSEGTIDISYSAEVGPTARGFIRNIAPTVEGSLNQPEAVREVMKGFKYATQVGQDQAAWGYLGLEKPNLDAVVQCGWGGCYELADLASRIANAGGLEAHPVGLFEETFGGHFVTYFPEQNLILDPSRSPIELLSPFEYFQKYGVSEFVLPR